MHTFTQVKSHVVLNSARETSQPTTERKDISHLFTVLRPVEGEVGAELRAEL